MRLPIFLGPELKIRRASCHLEELRSKWKVFLASNPHSVGVVDDIDEKSLNFKGFNKAPAEINIILGDVVHNLRASLDILVNDLAARNGKDTFALSFPFFKQRKKPHGFEGSRLYKDLRKTLSERDFSMIEGLQPYKGGKIGEWLRGLHDLDITDKHQTIIAHVARITVQDIRVTNPAGVCNFSIGKFTQEKSEMDDFSPFGQQAIRILGADAKVEWGDGATVEIVFEKGQPFEGEAIIQKMENMIGLVTHIVSQFK